jgi:RNA polymerase sigma-70 factor (ECF subfamily)
VPSRSALPQRLESVLRVIYLVFNEGYLASSGDALTRHDLSAKRSASGACWSSCCPSPRRGAARAHAAAGIAPRRAQLARGELVLLADQDRSLWNREQIDGRHALVGGALASRRFGPYTLQAAHRRGACRGRPRGAPTGRRSSASTTSCCAPSPRRSSS